MPYTKLCWPWFLYIHYFSLMFGPWVQEHPVYFLGPYTTLRWLPSLCILYVSLQFGIWVQRHPAKFSKAVYDVVLADFFVHILRFITVRAHEFRTPSIIFRGRTWRCPCSVHYVYFKFPYSLPTSLGTPCFFFLGSYTKLCWQCSFCIFYVSLQFGLWVRGHPV